ncbi:tol-pal system protein YbgF [Endozoicomonas sp. (ex Bugula neritina AB1)]|nr:tol-pal system protein YbgF [Endozoicomonas sp. (ex Bugula neritina AB1)]
MSLKQLSSSTLFLAGLLSAPVLAAAAPVVESLPAVEAVTDVMPLDGNESAVSEDSVSVKNSTAHFLHQIQELRNRNMTLEGRVEELEFQLKQNESEFRDRYLDLDARIGRLIEGGIIVSDQKPLKDDQNATTVLPAELGVISAPKSTEDQLIAREQADYQSAFGLIRDREFDRALVALRKFLKDYPQGELSDNAQYWLGEVLMAQEQYESARDEFKIVIAHYPDSAKVPDSAYKLGRLFDLLGNEAEARKYLESVVSQYPGSSAARLSDTYLQNMSGS